MAGSIRRSATGSGTIRLLAGRYYPLYLNFTKAGQGTKKPEQLRNTFCASINRARVEAANTHRANHSSDAPFSRRDGRDVADPNSFSDDRSTGVERGTSVSAEWDQAVTDAAIEVAAFVTSHLGDLCGIVEPEPKDEGRLKELCVRFAERAFRRPLNVEQKSLYIDGRSPTLRI